MVSSAGCPGVVGPIPRPVSMSFAKCRREDELGSRNYFRLFSSHMKLLRKHLISALPCTSVITRYYIDTNMKPNRNESDRKQRRAEEALFVALHAMTNTQELRKFFEDLCTPAELQALVDRWQVVEYLQKDLPYRKIHDLTGVSVTTIGRVARCLTDGSGGYQTAIERSSH